MAPAAHDLDDGAHAWVDFNIHAGTLLLARLISRFDGDLDLAIAAYNRGSGVAAGWVRDGEPMPERTRSNVDRVLRAKAWFERLAPTALGEQP